jgi:uncharacterized protein with NAD-binding domain and iron-sulfur cluster
MMNRFHQILFISIPTLLSCLSSFSRFTVINAFIPTKTFSVLNHHHRVNQQDHHVWSSISASSSSSLSSSNQSDGEESNDQDASMSTSIPTSPTAEKKNIVIIGSGWAGYTAAESLSQNDNVSITLLDASKNSGGLAGGFKTKTGRNVEAGIHGFWREYKNTFSIMDRIDGVGSTLSAETLGEYTPSVLFSKNGKVAVAPVLGGKDADLDLSPSSPSSSLPSPQQIVQDVVKSVASPGSLASSKLKDYLPPPLDIALCAEFSPSSPLSTTDRLSAIGLLGPWIDFQQESSTSWSTYDQFSAQILFTNKAGISKNLYEELIEPMLSVLPMCPDYDCSAAAVLSCFHVFALQSKGAFDVKWCRGSIREKIFDPWYDQLSSRGVEIRYNSRVVSIEDNEEGNMNAKYCINLQKDPNEENDNTISCDAIVLAVGGTAMGMITKNSPALNSLQSVQDNENFEKLRGVTCVAVRLFLKPHETITSGLKGGEYDKTQLPPDVANAMKDSPIAVCGPNSAISNDQILSETGFCIYDLQRMHDEFSVESTSDSNQQNDECAVIEVDFYRADGFVEMSNEEIANLALETIATTFKTKKIDTENIIDSAIVRARNAVSHFAPNSASYSPDVKLDNGLYICGDWVDRTGHASWSTEKAVVTGIQAASALSADFGLTSTYSHVIDAAQDTVQLSSLREVAKVLRTVAPPPGGGIPPSPWIFAKDVLSAKSLPFLPKQFQKSGDSN